MEQKPWLQLYPKEVPKTIKLDSNSTLISLFEEAFLKYKNLPMMENMGKVLRYKDVDRLSQNFASYIQNFTPLKPGDHVAIQLPNILQYPVAAIGLIRAGMVVVSINPLYTPYEMEKQITDAKVKAIIILENFADKLTTVLEKVKIETVIVAKVGDMLGTVKGGFINFILKNVKKIIPKYKLPQSIKFNDVLKLGRKKNFTRYETESSAVAFIQYTGGTTGSSKGAMLTHRNIVANIEQGKAWLCNKLKEGKETMITALPLYHIFALTGNMFTMIKIGAHNVLVTNPRNMKSFIKDLKRRNFTCLFGVSTLFNALMQEKKFSKMNFSSLKVVMAGGMSLTDKVAAKWEEITGVPIVEAYGLTETSPAVIGNPFDGKHKQGYVGIPIPNTTAKVVDENGNTVEYGTPGNLLLKGPQIMKGYWENPEETANVLKDGWLFTGDIAIMEKDGFIKIVDRKKDMINVSGFNVYPNEIENIIDLHPKVKEVAAIGVPYNEFRDTIKVFIVKKDESLTEEEVLTHCKQYLTAYKMPKTVEFRSDLPKSNVGKILRRVLKDEESK